MQAKHTPAERAAKYLKRCAHRSGGRRHFLVDCKFVRLISPHGKSTCFSVATDLNMPRAEWSRPFYSIFRMRMARDPALARAYRFLALAFAVPPPEPSVPHQNDF